MPVEDFLALPGALFILSSNNRNVKNLGETENSLRMKKIASNLSSAVILPLLSYLAQSLTGRCQSGQTSTPGKVCVPENRYRGSESLPVRHQFYYRNVFIMNILRFC